MDQNNNNNNVPLQEENNSGNIVWIILGIIILGAILWFIFGNNGSSDDTLLDNTNMEDMMEGDVTAEQVFNQEGDDMGEAEVLANVSNVRIEDNGSFPVTKNLIVTGLLPNGCTYLNDVEQIQSGTTFFVKLTTRTEGEVCTEAVVPFERQISLPTQNLPAGTYMVNVNNEIYNFEIMQNNAIDFEAGSDK